MTARWSSVEPRAGVEAVGGKELDEDWDGSEAESRRRT